MPTAPSSIEPLAASQLCAGVVMGALIVATIARLDDRLSISRLLARLVLPAAGASLALFAIYRLLLAPTWRPLPGAIDWLAVGLVAAPATLWLGQSSLLRRAGRSVKQVATGLAASFAAPLAVAPITADLSIARTFGEAVTMVLVCLSASVATGAAALAIVGDLASSDGEPTGSSGVDEVDGVDGVATWLTRVETSAIVSEAVALSLWLASTGDPLRRLAAPVGYGLVLGAVGLGIATPLLLGSYDRSPGTSFLRHASVLAGAAALRQALLMT